MLKIQDIANIRTISLSDMEAVEEKFLSFTHEGKVLLDQELFALITSAPFHFYRNDGDHSTNEMIGVFTHYGEKQEIRAVCISMTCKGVTAIKDLSEEVLFTMQSTRFL